MAARDDTAVTTVTTPSAREIVTSRVFHAPRDLVWRAFTEPDRLAMTFDWDGSPGHVSVTTITLEDLGRGRTRVVSRALFHTPGERDGMLEAGMADGLNESYAALDKVLAELA